MDVFTNALHGSPLGGHHMELYAARHGGDGTKGESITTDSHLISLKTAFSGVRIGIATAY